MQFVQAISVVRASVLACTLAIAFLSGCSHKPAPAAATQPGLLPNGVAQPRLREVLAYMTQRGIEKADQAAVFEFTFWPMYDDPDWDDIDRKPRFEGAVINYAGMRITVAVSPVRAYHSGGEVPEKVVQTYARKSKEPNGASIILDSRHWTIGFTMAQPDAKIREQLTEIIRDFAHGYAELESRYERKK